MEGTERGIRRWCEEENVIRLRVLIKAVSLNLLHTRNGCQSKKVAHCYLSTL